MSKANSDELLRAADALARSGDNERAEHQLKRFLSAAPKHSRAARARIMLAQVQMRQGRFEPAIEQLMQLPGIDGADPVVSYPLAQCYIYTRRAGEALAILDRILELHPEHERALARRAAVTHYEGDAELAAAMLDDAHARGLSHPELAQSFAPVAIRLGRIRDGVDRVRPFADDESLAPNMRAMMLFNLARLHEAEGDFDQAWTRYEQGNALSPVEFDPEEYEESVERIIATITPEAIRSTPPGAERFDRAVLILGMPRSGTTLVERVISAHPDAEVGGELPALPNAVAAIPGSRVGTPYPPLDRVRGSALKRAQLQYAAALNEISTAARRVTDKLPANYRFIGLMPALLPGAHIVHCRRDPRDTCLSCFLRNFVTGHGFTTRLDWLARYYLGYRRLMDHWIALWDELDPDPPMMHIDYEALTGSPEGPSRALVEFVGLPWNDACLKLKGRASLAPTLEPDQAGREVYKTSVARWKRYERHLGPLLDRLAPILDSDP